jgi:hypothetical protein
LNLFALLVAESLIQERKAAFKTADRGILLPAGRPKEIQATRNLCIFVATEDSGTETLERRQVQWRSDSF